MASLIALAGSFAGMQEILVATESSHAKKARRSGRGGAGPLWWRSSVFARFAKVWL
jgi:hypothetical protein